MINKEVVKLQGLTALEIQVLNAARKTNFGDCLESGQWSFAVCEEAQMDARRYRGVVSSLVAKGFVQIFDNEGKGRSNDMIFCYTDSGKALFEIEDVKDALAQDELRIETKNEGETKMLAIDKRTQAQVEIVLVCVVFTDCILMFGGLV